MTKRNPAFSILRTQEIPEIHSTATLFEHKKTKAKLLSLVNEDENKSFGITFRTPPPDSTGIAHIMEHSVLCGSKHYPLKEPFIELVKGSLNTFLNAFTYPDKTSYPVASTNEADFYNLTRVYLDAVFFPLLSKETLMQEGWHLHQEKEADAPVLKGVVFNEMKGAYNSPDRSLWDTVQSSLLPDTPYRYDSGGDPLHIPDLTYENFLQFHKTYYHPSNALLFFSGNDSVEKRLALADEYLSQFEFQVVDSAIPLQPSFNQPVTVKGTLALNKDDDPTKKGMVTLNWVLQESVKVEIGLRLRILSNILVGSPGSPLRKALIDSGIGEDIAGGGTESDLQQMIFSIGLKGMDVSKAKSVETLILSTLHTLVQEGIDPTIIEGAMNTTEFRLREQNTGSFPRGLSLLYSILPSWLYGGDPIEALSFQPPLDRLKQDLHAKKPVFESLIQRYFLDNQHRSTVILHPDTTELARREKIEADRVHKMSLTGVIEQTKKLQKLQEKSDSPEDLAKLPRLSRSDLASNNALIPSKLSTEDDIQFMEHSLATNGIIYTDLVFDLHAVSEELLPLLPLFSRCLLEMGTASESFDVFLHRQNRESGGIWTDLLSSAQWKKEGTVIKLLLRGKCLSEQLHSMSKLFQDALQSSDLTNKDRFMQMLLEEKTDYETSILEDGHQFADSRIRAQYHQSDWIDEKLSGVEQLFFIRQLIKEATSDWDSVQKKLESLRELIVTKHKVLVNITTDVELLGDAKEAMQQVISGLSDGEGTEQVWKYSPSHTNELIQVATTVNYVGKGINLYQEGYEFDGSILVISRFLRSTWLWEQVRMKGGAYGGFSTFDPLSGTFTFMSYRDPRLEETLATFDETARFLQSLRLPEEELTKAIIGTLSDYDRYQLPDAKGFTSLTRHLVGMSEERRQQTRDEILSTTEADFHDFAKELEKLAQKGIVAITTSKESVPSILANKISC